MSDDISLWREKYETVYRIEFDDEEYIFRNVKIGDVEISLDEKISDLERQDRVVRNVLLNKKDINNIPAGIVTYIYKKVIMSAGVYSPKSVNQVMANARKDVKNSLNENLMNMKITIMRVFPGYTLEKLNDIDVYQFFKLVALSEEITGEKLIQDNAPHPPNSNKKKRKKKSSLNNVNRKQYDKIASVEAGKSAEKLKKEYLKFKEGK